MPDFNWDNAEEEEMDELFRRITLKDFETTRHDWKKGLSRNPGNESDLDRRMRRYLCYAAWVLIGLAVACVSILAANIHYYSGADRLSYLMGKDRDTTYNTVTTEPGSLARVVFSDGSRACLNSGSTITYPVRFRGGRREVNLTGEAYFEVAGNISAPFIVHANFSRIQALGTRFDVMAYPEDTLLVATLVEGTVKVTWGKDTSILRRRGQALISPGSGLKVLQGSAGQAERAIAWRDGVFCFDSLELRPALRQVAQWYNVEVDYAGDVPMDTLGGKIPRKYTLSQVLEMIRASSKKADVRLEDGRIVVRPRSWY